MVEIEGFWRVRFSRLFRIRDDWNEIEKNTNILIHDSFAFKFLYQWEVSSLSKILVADFFFFLFLKGHGDKLMLP